MWGVSVVPQATRKLKQWADSLEVDFHVLSRKTLPFKSLYSNSLGADRLLNAYAAYKKYSKPLVVFDFGTALTVDYVDGRGCHRGGFIVPGPRLALSSLHAGTALLPKVAVKYLAKGRVSGRPEGAVHYTRGRTWPLTTASAMQEGQTFLIESLFRGVEVDIWRRYGVWPLMVVTGGDAPRHLKGGFVYEPQLTLFGLQAWAESQLE